MKARVIPASFLLAVISIYLAYYFGSEIFMIISLFVCAWCLILKLIFKRKIALIALCCIWVMFFTGYTAYKADNSDSELNKYVDSECMIYGKVIHEGNKNEFYESYTLKIDKVAEIYGKDIVETKEKADFSVMVEKNKVNFKYGDYIYAKVKVEKVDGADNTGETDFARIKSADSIFYSLTAKAVDIKRISKFEKISDISDFSYVIRKYVYDISEKMLSEKAAAFVSCVLVSERKYLNEDTLKTLENAGIMHLGAASGLHVGCIITLITFLFGLLYVKRKNALLIAVPAIIIYIFINGGSISIIRAAIMTGMVILAEFIKREVDILISLCFSGVLLLLENPLNAFSVGFVLSFSSVAAIAVFTEDILKIFNKIPKKKIRGNEFIKKFIASIRRYIKTTASVCIAVQIVIMPLCAYYFEYISVYSVISNLLISWILPFFMLSAFLMLAFGFFEPVCKIFAYCTEAVSGLILNIARAIGSFPGARIECYITPGVVVFLLIFALSVHFFIKKKKKTAVFLSAICAIMLTVNLYSIFLQSNTVKVSFVNVGQADGCMIKTNSREAIVIDNGGSGISEEDVVFVPYMKRNGIKKVSYIFISHYDADHAKNVLHILDEFEVENVVLPIRVHEVKYKTLIENKAKEKQCNIIYAKTGTEIGISEDIKAKIYAQTKYLADYEDENNASIVIKMDISGKELLFLGDMEADAQRQMSKKYADELKCDIIKIAHHGSADAYCRELMDFANPKMAVISCGENNIYNHPDESVVLNLARRKIRTFITAEQGDISFYIKENEITKINCFK